MPKRKPMKNDFFDSDDAEQMKTTGPKVTVIVPQDREKSLLPPKPSTGKRILKGFLILMTLAVLGVGGFAIVRATDLTNKIFVGEKSSFYSKLNQLVRSATGRDIQLIGEGDGQVNILLLGIGGAGHDGGYLSDTMILAQIRPEDKKVSLISIPRDYLADLGPALGQRKINAAFAEGYNKNKNFNDGGKAAIAAVEKISGLKIPYFAVVDFAGFQEGVDVIGGVDIDIERTFTDYSYPDNNEGYIPAVTFKAGVEHMNGKRALIFARSRHAAGPEGSDFARSARQQKVMQAVKDKATSLNVITDSGKLNELITVLGNHFHTNIQLDEMLKLYGLSKDFGQESIVSLNLDPSTNLICPEILQSNGAYVLSPCPGKKNSDIQNFFKNSFDSAQAQAQQATIWLADSTTGEKNYNAAEKELKALGLTVYKVTYSSTPISKTVYYQVNDKPGPAEMIQKEFGASKVTLPPSGIKIDKSKVDILVIIGTDYVAPQGTVQSATTKAPTTPTPTVPTTKPTTPTTPPTPKTPTPTTPKATP